MIDIILFILIGLKLEMMSGLYQALIIIAIVLWIIKLLLSIIKFGITIFKD